jgi:hypothetical protein
MNNRAVVLCGRRKIVVRFPVLMVVNMKITTNIMFLDIKKTPWF